MSSSRRFVVALLNCALLASSGSALAADPAFAPAQQLPAGTTPVDVVVGDFDGDLELDIATADAARALLPANLASAIKAATDSRVALAVIPESIAIAQR